MLCINDFNLTFELMLNTNKYYTTCKRYKKDTVVCRLWLKHSLQYLSSIS